MDLTHEILKHAPPIQEPHGQPGDMYHSLNAIKAIPGVIVEEPIPEVYVAVRLSEDTVIVDFAAFEWCSEEDDDVCVHLLFYGHGTGSGLREMRHTYWGRDGDGYLFYMPINKTIAALEVMKKYFNPDE